MSKPTPEFDKAVQRCIPAEFMLISATQEDKEAHEVYNAGLTFGLPNSNHKAGSTCTSTFVKFLYDNDQKIKEGQVTWSQALNQMQGTLDKSKMGDDQEFQLSSSRPIDPSKPFQLGPSGRHRALLIGINYTGQPHRELKAPHNDCKNTRDALVNVMGFSKQEIMILQDDSNKADTQPTKSNILSAFAELVQEAQPGDVCFIGYSGHGGRIKNHDGTKSDYDYTIIPVDWETSGQIKNDQLLLDLVKTMPKGVHVTMLFDCCHSGSVVDLPYSMGVHDKSMKVDQVFNMDTIEEANAKVEAAKRAKQEKKAAKKAANKAEYDKKVARIKEVQAEVAAQPIQVIYQQQPGQVVSDDLPAQMDTMQIHGAPADGSHTVTMMQMPMQIPAGALGDGSHSVTMMQMPMQIPAGATITMDPNGQPMINGEHIKLPPGAVVTSAVMQTGPAVQISADVINGK